MQTNGLSLNIGRQDSKWSISFGATKIGNPKPQVNGKDCWLGLRFDIVWGPLVLPVAKIYHWRFWVDKPTYSQQWNNGNQWFTIKLPFFCFFLLSVMVGEWNGKVPGFYIGARTANLNNPVDWQLRLDWNKSENDRSAWAFDSYGNPIEAWPVGKYKNQKTVELSLAIRSDFKH